MISNPKQHSSRHTKAERTLRVTYAGSMIMNDDLIRSLTSSSNRRMEADDDASDDEVSDATVGNRIGVLAILIVSPKGPLYRC
jgi:hypothetical protein